MPSSAEQMSYRYVIPQPARRLPQPPAVARNGGRRGNGDGDSSSSNSSLGSKAPASRPSSNNNNILIARNDIFTCWRSYLPNGRLEVRAKASQTRLFAPSQLRQRDHGREQQQYEARSQLQSESQTLAKHPHSQQRQQQLQEQQLQLKRQLNQLPSMVHTTRHHDYDHDVDVDSQASFRLSSESESEPEIELEPELEPKLEESSIIPKPKKRASRAKARAPEPPLQYSKVPPVAQFPLLIVGNLVLSALLYSAVMPFTAGDLAAVSRNPGGWLEIASLVAFKTAELALGWWGRFDGYDIAALTLLTHTPYLFLLTMFYSVRPSTIFASLLIDVTSVLVPIQFLRPLSAAHTPKAAAAGVLANRNIISDLPVQVYVSSLASAVYALTLMGSMQLGLPALLVGRFDSISSVTAAYSPYLLPQLLLIFLPLGFAAEVFVFAPSTAATRDSRDASVERFNPEVASFADTLLWNVWGYRRRTRVTIIRTGLLVAVTAVNTWLQVVAHVAGTDAVGAAVWAAVWSVGASATGYVLWWVANVSEVK